MAATIVLADLKMLEGRWAEAIEGYQEARALADDLNALPFQMETRLSLSRALIQLGELSRASALAEEAAKYRAHPAVLAFRGIAVTRQGDRAAAQQAFAQALEEAERLLAGKEPPYETAYTKALALAGLALCRDASLATAAAEAYRDARAISAAPSDVADAVLDLDALAVADTFGILKPVRAAACGEA